MNKKITSYTTSKKLLKNTQNFISIKLLKFFSKKKNATFYGWGRKKSGFKAVKLAQKYKTSFVLLEDGFIRSLGLGVEDSPSFSLVEDDVGIYYDATAPSKLENLLNHYDFQSDAELMQDASRAIALIKEHHISKYNNAPHITNDFFKNKNEQRVLVIAQTAGDSSLEYGMLENFTTQEMIQSAIEENPNATVYIKIHPDVLSGKKASDIEVINIPKKCIILDQNVNPLSLLKYFQKVYTKTSGMGFEALLVGCECICFGMPFYAGWGVTTDKSTSTRRQAKRSIEEVFAAAYILYTRYYNPYKKRECDIFEVIEEINLQRKRQQNSIKYDYLCLGDSHIRVFENPLFKLLPQKFTTCYVPGATAYGIENINSQTQAYHKFLLTLNQYNYNKIIVTLGEVDASYTLWLLAKKHNKPIEELLNIAITRYINFLKHLLSYGKVYIIGAPLPTVQDTAICDDSISGIRKTISVPMQDKIAINQQFNHQIEQWSQQQKDIVFIDTSSYIYHKKVKKIFLPRNPCDHHYHKYSFALLLIWLFLKQKF